MVTFKETMSNPNKRKKPRLDVMYTRTDPITGNLGRIRKKDDKYWRSFTRRAQRKRQRRERVSQQREKNQTQQTNIRDNVDDERNIEYLKLDDYMVSIDYDSLNKLTTAQLMQRLRANNLECTGLKHELIERWRNYKLSQ